MVSSILWLPLCTGSLWLLGADCEICESTQTARFSAASKICWMQQISMRGCSQEVFSVPGSENTRPTQGNAFTCHIQERHQS